MAGHEFHQQTPAIDRRQLSKEQRAGIEAVGIDRSGAYQAAVEAWLPNEEIVYDRFHLIMNVNQAVDEVRRTQCRKVSKEDRQLIKGQRYLKRLLGQHKSGGTYCLT